MSRTHEGLRPDVYGPPDKGSMITPRQPHGVKTGKHKHPEKAEEKDT